MQAFSQCLRTCFPAVVSGGILVASSMVAKAEGPSEFANGSFEQVTGSVPDFWTGSGPYVIQTAGSFYLADDGARMVVFSPGAFPPGASLSQTFLTTPGQPYLLEFDLGIVGNVGTGTQTMETTVTGATAPFVKTETLTPSGSAKWTGKTYPYFIAGGTSATLTFRDISAGSTNRDMMLDNVRVTPLLTRSLTVNSTPVSGASVTVSPADLEGAGDGVTTLARSYLDGETVNLAVPAVIGSTTFERWLEDGLTYGTAPGTSVTLSANRVLTAIYNEAPDAVADTYATDEDAALVVAAPGVLDNDSDAEANPLTAALVATTTHGTLELNADGGFTYTPAGDYHGGDEFTYRALDALGQSAVTSVSITVNPVNDLPVATAGSASVDEDSTVDITLTGSDIEPLDTLTFSIVDQPANGSATLVGTTATYLPAADFNGADSFTFKINDGTGDSNTATILITVNPVNDLPVANSGSVSVDEDSAVDVTLTGSDLDPLDTLTFSIVDQPANGSVTLVGSTATYLPAADFNGADSFTFKISDGTGDSNTATISITVNQVNDLPFANADSASVDEDSAVDITLTGSDIEPLDTLTYLIVDQPANGSVTLVGSTATYLPAADFNGADSFTFKINDGTGDSNTATISITVNPVNDLPVANSDSASVDEGNSVDVTLTGSDIDPLDSLTYAIVDQPANGSVTLVGTTATYLPAAGFNGADSFTFKINDGTGDSNTATISITVNPVNNLPVAYAGSAAVDAGSAVAITLAGSDPDPLDTLTYLIVDRPANGLVTLVGNTATYLPAANFSGTDSFTFRINDGTGDSNTATVSITVKLSVFEGLSNGSFETGAAVAPTPTVPFSHFDLDNWTVTGNSVGFAEVAGVPAADGVRMAVFNGATNDFGGTVSQTFGTVPGLAYRLQFDAAITGGEESIQLLGVAVTGAGASSLLAQDLAVAASIGEIVWAPASYTFTANGTSATLTFTDKSGTLAAGAANGSDLLLDHVYLELVNDPYEDADKDGLTRAQESIYGTSDSVYDYDGDGVSDGAEVAAGTSPTDPNSWPQTTILGWGRSRGGEQAMPVGVEFIALSTGQNHSLALRADGSIAAWGGFNEFGQTTPPAGLTDVVALAAGGDFWIADSAHSLALRNDGTVAGWGYEGDGRLVVPAGLGQVVEISAGRSHCIALKSDGSVVTWGFSPFGVVEPPPGLTDVVAVSAGGFQCLALKGDGTVATWGNNFDGRRWVESSAPVGLCDVVSISCGRFHSLALKSDGTVVAWGLNEHGQTDVPAGLSGVVAVAAGGFHSLALKDDGSVVAWGFNDSGQVTVPLAARSGVKMISAGLLHSLAVRQGANAPEITSPPTILSSPGAAVAHQVVVSNPGTANMVFSAIGLPSGLAIDPASGLISGVVATAARRSVRIQVKVGQRILTQAAWLGVSEGSPPTAVALTPAAVMENSPQGTVIGILSATDPDEGDTHTFEWVDAAGSADNGMFRIEGDQLILNQELTRDFEKNPAGFSIRVRARDASLNPYERIIPLQFLDDRTEDADGDGLTEAEEEDVYGTSDTVYDKDGDGFGDGFEVARGTNPTLAGSVPSGRIFLAWGDDSKGQTGLPAGLEDVIDLSAGHLHSLALKSDGTVIAWGDDESGQSTVPENLQQVIAVEAGFAHSMALRRDGTVIAWGDNDTGQTDVPGGLSNVVAISAGSDHNLALKSDGTVTAWGADEDGQADVPPGLTDVVAVAAGGFHSLALKSDGTVVAWGTGGAIVVPEGLNGVIAIAAGSGHCLALRYDGTVMAWGDDGNGQADVPEGLADVTAISAGWRHSLALKADGTLVAWGDDALGETKIPVEARQIRRVEAGGFHNLAIRQNAGFPGFADVSPVRAWPGETVSKPTVIENASVSPIPGAENFTAMGLPAGLQINSATGLVAGIVTTGARRAVRISADTDQGMLSRVIWFNTADGVAPTGITLSANVLKENSAAGTVVGTLGVVDPNVGDSHTLKLVTAGDAPDSFWFMVSGNQLVLRFPLGVDYDSGISELHIRVSAVDSANNILLRDFVLQITDDRSEDADGDLVIESVEEDLFGSSDTNHGDIATSDGDHDGMPGIIEYAFNLDPHVPGLPLRLVPGAGSTAGLPAIDLVVDAQGHRRLRMEFLRRIGGEVVYQPQFSSGLGVGAWEPASAPAVTPINGEWERCVVMDAVSMDEAPRRFGRVGVAYAGDRSRDNDLDGINQEMEEDVFGTSDFAFNDFKTEDTDGDGVPSMIEYAFNLDPRVAGPPIHMIAGANSAEGLPAITLVGDGAGHFRLRIEYLRRVGSLLTYTPQFGSGLGDWTEAANPVSVTQIDGGWQRCVVEDTLGTADAPRRFARVLISW